MAALTSLEAGQIIVYGGNSFTTVSADMAAAFTAGDRLIVVDDTGDLLHVPAADVSVAQAAVGRASAAFAALGSVTDEAITEFFEQFAALLADDSVFDPISAANRRDVEAARERGRSTTRLELTDSMRADMIAGLRSWRDAPSGRDAVIETIEHEGWRVEQRRAGLGVVGFVFEGRPNVFADACGVIRSGNTVVFRIGSDALGTAKAIVEHALDPALAAAGLPDGSASLVASANHAAGHAMFDDRRLALAVARGSGHAVAQLGSIARQAGTPVSLHGTGGAWIVADHDADADRLEAVVRHSLDRKVCNTLNTMVVTVDAAARLVPSVLAGLLGAADGRGTNAKLHVAAGSESFIPDDWFERRVLINRAAGDTIEPQAESIDTDLLGHEWEWEGSPEITLIVVESIAEAVTLFNSQSPRFVASLLSEDPATHDAFWNAVDAPFVGDGFTRWVDGQYALDKPELGLSNWQAGRLFSRSGVLSGDSVFSVRCRVVQSDPGVHR